MFDFMNWHHTSILFQYNWFWILLALALGFWIGHKTSENTSESGK